MATTSPMRTTRASLKRTAEEAAATDADADASPTEPVAPTPTKPSTKIGSNGNSMPFKSPNSEVKKQTAAQSLAHLFQAGSESFDSKDEPAEAGSSDSNNKKAEMDAEADDAVADLMSADLMSANGGSGEDGGDDGMDTEPAPVDATDATATADDTIEVANLMSAAAAAANNLATIDEEEPSKGGEIETAPETAPPVQPQQSLPPPTDASNESYQVGFASPRKKSRTSKSPPTVHLATAPVPAVVPPRPVAVVARPQSVAVPVLPPTSMPETPADKAAAEVAVAEEVVAETMNVMEFSAGDDVAVATTAMPATTPQRAAGASALASLSVGAKTQQDIKGVLPHGIPMMPLVLPQGPIAEISTSGGGMVQHDYLLQNLVQATKVTSPLPVPGKGKKYTTANMMGGHYPGVPPGVPTGLPGIPPIPVAPPQQTKSRKEKSLGVLCQNFMDLFKNAPPNRNNNGTVIEICQVSEHLGVKRRRIYDVINILESIDIVCRVKKNTYRWHGKDDLPRFFAELQKAGLQERANQEAVASAAAAAASAAMAAAGGSLEEQQAAQQAAAAAQHQQINSAVKTKGMAQTCQKLIQIFLVTGRVEIGLTDAAEEVLGPLSPQEEANAQRAMKTKVRRMYDIANVLQSIGILQKENVGSTSLQNKPSFRWVFHILPGDMSKYSRSKPAMAPVLASVPQLHIPRHDDLSHVPMDLPPGPLPGTVPPAPMVIPSPVAALTQTPMAPVAVLPPAPVAAAPAHVPMTSVAVAALQLPLPSEPPAVPPTVPPPASQPEVVPSTSNGSAAAAIPAASAPPGDNGAGARAPVTTTPVTPEDTSNAVAAAVSAAQQAQFAAATAAAQESPPGGEDENVVQV